MRCLQLLAVKTYDVTKHFTMSRVDDLDVDGIILLKWISWKWDEQALTGLPWLRIGTSGGRL